ncbi:hypothetical protein BC567DRAFT_222754 [Phyllosticta citribraziliensis]
MCPQNRSSARQEAAVLTSAGACSVDVCEGWQTNPDVESDRGHRRKGCGDPNWTVSRARTCARDR